MRQPRIALAAIVAATALALTGCAGTSTPSLSGPAVQAISVSGSFDQKPTVDIPTPLVAERTECETVLPGDGVALQNGQMLQAELSVYNGRTGTLIQQTSYNGSDEQSLVMGSTDQLPGITTGLKCASAGARVVIAIPPADGFGSTGSSQWGIGATDTLVVVADITRVYLAAANGTPQLSQDGMPMVVLATNGQPGIVVPKTDPPKNERISVLKLGNGAVVKSGQKVTVHYVGALWADGTVFQSSWENGTPVQFTVGDGINDQSQVVQGFSNALIGQRVGSQVLAVIPPSLGYGSQGNSTIPANSTLVFVIDILGVD